MNTKRMLLTTLVAVTGLAACVFMIIMLAPSQSVSAIDVPPVTFPGWPDPPWPWYAQEEIFVNPEPPQPGHPVEICAEVVSNDPANVHVVELAFGVAPFGIGRPFEPIGAVEVDVPPSMGALGCVGWVPPEPGPWAFEAILFVGEFEPQRSLRVVDLWEPLVSGDIHEKEFVVGPFEIPGQYNLTAVPAPNWEAALKPDVVNIREPGMTGTVVLHTQPPSGIKLGSRLPVVDVEMMLGMESVGGFVKYDNPPVLLHRNKDPFFAESEISVWPYPPRAGEPTELCVDLYNISDIPQTVVVNFSRANFGIGLPWDPVNGPIEITIPRHSQERVCTVWVPEAGGHFCVEVELNIKGEVKYLPQYSQRNLDVAEPLVPGEPHELEFNVGNFPQFTNPVPVKTDIRLEYEIHLPGWDVSLNPMLLKDVLPYTSRKVVMGVYPPAGVPLPPDGTPIVDVRALIGPIEDPIVIGGFRKIYRPPVILHRYPDPIYAEREITVHPYPSMAGEPTEICVDLYNPTPFPQDVEVQFSWANFGIGIPFTPINGLRMVHLPPFSMVRECIHWIPPVSGHVCLQVEVFKDNYPPQKSQRNIDVNEPLEPLKPHTMTFPVGNPIFDDPVDIHLGIIPHLDGWEISLDKEILEKVEKDKPRLVELTVKPPKGELPPDGTPIADIEAYAEGRLIGGFRKIFRPPVPIHRPKDPIYAESEIFIHPYPPRAHEPVEIGVEIGNPTSDPQDVLVQFSYANFGIGLPFTPINGPIPVTVPPEGFIVVPIMWVPPIGGHWCIQVEIIYPDTDKAFFSQRNIDVGEPLEPGVSHSLVFPVGNPFDHTVDIYLGIIPHQDGWDITLDPEVLEKVEKGEIRDVTLTVKPPEGELPPDGAPVVDIEAYVEGQLIGGFRKIFRPPVPVHRPKDPVYAESEIGIDPYPAIAGVETELSVEVFNPTPNDEIVEATFSIARFGIGLPFSKAGITTNPIKIFVPAGGAARGHTKWTPPWPGKYCVMVELKVGDHEVVWSQRNIDVGEPLKPGLPHKLEFSVGNPMSETHSIQLGLIKHRDDIKASLSDTKLPDVEPGDTVSVTLTVSPTQDAELGTGEPIVDVEAFIDGELIGGFRKVDVPPINIHKPHEKVYAESDIYIIPEPPLYDKPTTVGTVVKNDGPAPITVDLEFGWAQFGIGIPFSTTGMVPYTRTVTVGAGLTKTAEVTWTPSLWGSHCVIIHLQDRDKLYEPQWSQRNVYVEEEPPCGEKKHFSFTLENSSPLSVTLDLGLITFNVPAHWIVTTVPSGSVEMGPNEVLTVDVFVEIPCPPTIQGMSEVLDIQRIQAEAGSVPTIDVEGYIDGDLVGGIEIRLPADYTPPWTVLWMPIVGNSFK